MNVTLNLSINTAFWLFRYGVNKRLLGPKIEDIKEGATECIPLPVSVPTSQRLSTPYRMPICLPVECNVCARVIGLGWGCLACLRLLLFWFLEDVSVSVVVTSLATLRVRTWDEYQRECKRHSNIHARLREISHFSWASETGEPVRKSPHARKASHKSTVILYVCSKSRVDTCAIIGKQLTSWDSNPVNSTSSNKHIFEMLDRSKKLGNNLASEFRRRINARLQGRIVSWENVSYRVRTDFFPTFFQNNNFFFQTQGYRTGDQYNP